MAVIGALQSVIIVCGALLRPIVLKPGGTDADRMSLKQLEDLNTQDKAEDSDLTRGSDTTGDSGVQSLKDVEKSSPEEKTLLEKEEKLEAEVTSLETSMVEMRDSEKPSKDVEKQAEDEQLPAKSSKLLDFSILRECSFILYSMFGLFATLGFFAPPLYVIDLSVSRGLERSSATYMLSTMAVAEIFGRFSIGWVLSRRLFMGRKLQVLLVCVVMMAADLVGFTLVQEFYGLAVCCAFYGFLMGTIACTHIPLLAEEDVVGIERMSSAAGVYVFIHSFAGLAGPPLGGKRGGAHCGFGLSRFYPLKFDSL